MKDVILSKTELLLITSLAAYLTLITFFIPIQIPCLFTGSNCPVRYGFPVPVYILNAGQIQNPYKNYWALPENFFFWLVVLFIFHAVVRVVLGSLKRFTEIKR